MAGTVVAYSEITILDLIDTATYIYYAKDENGSGAITAPEADSKYIGIYSGPPVGNGQPSYEDLKNTEGFDSNWSGWTKYVGEKGEPGEPGEPGKDANSYFIETNQTEILKFAVRNSGYQISPEKLTFSIYKRDLTNSDGKTLVGNPSKSNLSLFIQGNEGFDELDTSSVELNANEFTFYLTGVSALTERNETVLKIQYKLEDADGTHMINSFLPVRYGFNSDMASLSLEAGGIVAAMQDSKMKFDANGLLIENGAFKIVKTQDDKVTPLLYAENGNLTLKGTVYATNGEFSGKVIATEGSFKGSIEAASGKIGGFTISEGALVSTGGNGAI